MPMTTTRSATRLFPPAYELTLDTPSGEQCFLKLGDLWFVWREFSCESKGWMLVDDANTLQDLNQRLAPLL